MPTGSCGCGAVRYEVTEPFVEMHNCHCELCRKTHGAAFATFAQTYTDGFRVVAGSDRLRAFGSSSHGSRYFCGTCGSHVYFQTTLLPGRTWVTGGTLDGDPGVRPRAESFVTAQAPWHTIGGGLPRFAEYPPFGDDMPVAVG